MNMLTLTTTLTFSSLILLLVACGKSSGGGEGAGVQLRPLSCVSQPSPARGRILRPEEVIDGRQGIYRLVELSEYAESYVNDKNLRSSFYGTSLVSHRANDSKVTDVKVTCSDISDIPEGRVHGSVRAPLTISRKNGTVSKDLELTISVYGESTELESEMSATHQYPEFSNFLRSIAGDKDSSSTLTEINGQSFELVINKTVKIMEWDSAQQKSVERGTMKIMTRAIYQYVNE